MSNMLPVGAQLQNIATANISGKNHATYDGVLNRAHRDATDRGLFLVGTKIEIVQIPHASNGGEAIIKVQMKFWSLMDTPVGATEYTFEAVADASPANCSGQTASAVLRMAETRAKSRALRDALNVKEAVAEEIAENGGSSNAPASYQQNYQAPQQQYQAPAGQAQPYGQPAQQGYPAQGQQQQGGQKPWNGTLWWGENRGKHISDPIIPMGQLEWSANKTKDPQQRDMILAEMARRSGQVPANAPPPPPQNFAPAAYGPPPGQPPQAPPAYAPPPPAQQAYAPPPAAYAPPGVPPQPGGGISPQDVAELVALGGQRGMQWPQITELSQARFGKNNPATLTHDEANMLRLELGGQAR